MKLPFAIPFGKKDKPNFFLALLLRDEKVSAVIFEEFAGKIKVVGEADDYFENSIEEASGEELLELCDKVVSQAGSGLSLDMQTLKTVLGLKEAWVEQTKIKPQYLSKLKKISDELGLSPIGFLTIHEAVAHLMQEEEGAPVSAILIEKDKNNLTISLLRGGRIIETRSAAIEDSIAKTTDKILHHFTNYEVLPSRIAIFNGKESEELSQEFISHPWSKSLPFLHVPQITALSKGFDAKAVLFGAATQMGFEVLKSKAGQDFPKEKIEEENYLKLEEQEDRKKDNILPDNTVPVEITKEDNFGFIKDGDVAEILTEEILEETVEKKQPEISIDDNFVIPEGTAFPSTAGSGKKIGKTINLGKFIFSKINLKKSLPSFSFLSGSKKIIFIPPFVIGVFVLILVLYIFALKATIIISVSPKTVEKNKDLIFSTKGVSDFTKNTIAGVYLDIAEDGEISQAASGKKEVGDKAKGSVTLYSRLTENRVFPPGTIITSGNNLQFTFDSDVKLSSASADASSPPVTAKVLVTARDIGKESNLPSGSKFTIGQLPAITIIAKNDAAFSGGSRKEITVVSKEDLSKLEDGLIKKLEEKAKEDAAGKISKDKSLLPAFVSTSFAKKVFDKKQGNEATSVKLTGTVVYRGISYRNGDLAAFSEDILKENVQDMTFSRDSIKYDVTDLKQKGEDILTTVHIEAFLLPKLDQEKLKQSLIGKSFKEAKDYLLGIPQISKVSISTHPSIPFIPNILPRISKNISFVIQVNE